MTIKFNGVRVISRASSGGGNTVTYSESLNDSIDASTMLLLHMDGDNNSTTFTDSSSTPLVAGVSGGAKISTDISKFGGASGYFNGTDSFIYYSSSDEFTLTNRDWTIEAWLYFPSVPNTTMCLIGKHHHFITYDYGIYISNATTITWAWDEGGGSQVSEATVPSIAAETWHHVAVVRSSGQVKIYWNGIHYGSAVTANPKTTASLAVTIGCDRISGPNLFFNGYIDEFRISHAARYTDNFTVQSVPFGFATNLPSSPSVADVVYSDSSAYICTSASPVTWKQFSQTGNNIIP